MSSSSYTTSTWSRQQQQQSEEDLMQQHQQYLQQNNNNDLWQTIGESWTAIEAHEDRRNVLEDRINQQQMNLAEDLLTDFSFGGGGITSTTSTTSNSFLPTTNTSESSNQGYNNNNLILPNQPTLQQLPQQQQQFIPPYQNQLQQQSLSHQQQQQPLIPHQHQIPLPLAQSQFNPYPFPLPPAPPTSRFQPSHEFAQLPTPPLQHQQQEQQQPQQHSSNHQPPLISRDSGFIDSTNGGGSRHRSIGSYGHYHNVGAVGGYPEAIVPVPVPAALANVGNDPTISNQIQWNPVGGEQQITIAEEVHRRTSAFLYSDSNGHLYDSNTQSYLPSPPATSNLVRGNQNQTSSSQILAQEPHPPSNFIPRNSNSFSSGQVIPLQHLSYPRQPQQEQQSMPLISTHQKAQYHIQPSSLPSNSSKLPYNILETPPPPLYEPLYPYNNSGNTLISPPSSRKTVSPSTNPYSENSSSNRDSSIYSSNSPPIVSPIVPLVQLHSQSHSHTHNGSNEDNSQAKRSRIVIPKVPLVTPYAPSVSTSSSSSTSTFKPSPPNTLTPTREDTSPEGEDGEGEEEADELIPESSFAVLPPTTSSKKQNKKMTVEVICHCTICGILIAKAILRARPTELSIPYSPSFVCINCSPHSTSNTNNTESSQSPENTTTTTNSTNEGSINSPPTTTATQSSSTPLINPTFRKKYKRSNDSLTCCDVCLRDVAFGSIITNSTSLPVSYPVEIICESCFIRYRRCTDCGGGGGVRLGVGKWRCREMFAPGRRTCKLSHLRLGKFEEMTYEVWKITEIPREEIDELEEKVKELFVSTLLSAMAIPEILERPSVQVGIASITDYASVEKFATGGFDKLCSMLKIDIEPTQSIRRYISLRFCTPNPRKGLKKIETPASADADFVVLRPSQELVGFVMAEYDYVYGTLFTSVVVPWANGDALDATTTLLQKLLIRVDTDRTALNLERKLSGYSEDYPLLLHVWTMMFFSKDSRMRVHLEKKRGFILFNEYLQKYPDTDLRAFPPNRPVYIPPPALPYWDLLIKRGGPNVFVSRRVTEDSKGKKREAKTVEQAKGSVL